VNSVWWKRRHARKLVSRKIYPASGWVAQTPTQQVLQKLGFEVLMSPGWRRRFTDDAYRQAGCQSLQKPRHFGRKQILCSGSSADMQSNLGKHEVELLCEGGTLISFIWPAQIQICLIGWQGVKLRCWQWMRCRASASTKMDALSSMANIAGYRAVIEAANNFGRFFGQITAAGKVPRKGAGDRCWCSWTSSHRYC